MTDGEKEGLDLWVISPSSGIGEISRKLRLDVKKIRVVYGSRIANVELEAVLKNVKTGERSFAAILNFRCDSNEWGKVVVHSAPLM